MTVVATENLDLGAFWSSHGLRFQACEILGRRRVRYSFLDPDGAAPALAAQFRRAEALRGFLLSRRRLGYGLRLARVSGGRATAADLERSNRRLRSALALDAAAKDAEAP